MITLAQAANIKGWYVYFLLDSRDGTIFYVGKGTRFRKEREDKVSGLQAIFDA